MSRIREIEVINDVQDPVPISADSVFSKDIDINNSDNGGFSGIVTDYFDSLKTVNNDSSATNPKIIKVWFNRTIQMNAIGFGCDDLTKSFSNIKIKALGSGEVVRFTKDLSTDSTKRNSYVVNLPPLALNGIIIEFHTTDEIGLSNFIVWKAIDVNSRISATSELTGEIEAIGSFRGALNVNQALVHKKGINEYLKQEVGGATTLSVAASAGDTSITVASTTGFAIGDTIRLSTSTFIERSYFNILNIVGNVFTLNRPIDNDLPMGADVIEINISMNLTGTLGSPLSFKIQPPSFERWQLTRLLITMLDSTAMDDGTFGGMTALTNGVVIRTSINNIISTVTFWTINKDLKDDMFNVEYALKAPAGQYGLNGRWTLTLSEFVIDLDGDAGDYLELLVQDDLSPLDEFNVKAQGRLFGE